MENLPFGGKHVVHARLISTPDQALESQRAAVLDVLHLVQRLISQSPNGAGKQADSRQDARPHDQYRLICGRRGAGKTSTFLTLKALLSPEDTNFVSKSAWTDAVVTQQAATMHVGRQVGVTPSSHCWTVCVSPTDMRDDEQLMERLMACLLADMHRQKENLGRAPDCARQSPVTLQRLEGLFTDLKMRIFPAWTYGLGRDGWEIMSRDAADFREYGMLRARQARENADTVQRWRLWLRDALEVLGKQVMVIMVDDADVPPLHVADTLHAMRMFLDHPQIVVVLCGDDAAMVQQLVPVVYQAMLPLGPSPLNNLAEAQQHYWDLASKEATRLMLKLLPPSQRLHIGVEGVDRQRLRQPLLELWRRERGTLPTLLGSIMRGRIDPLDLVESLREFHDLVAMLEAHRQTQLSQDATLWAIAGLPSLAVTWPIRHMRRPAIARSQNSFAEAYLLAEKIHTPPKRVGSNADNNSLSPSENSSVDPLIFDPEALQEDALRRLIESTLTKAERESRELREAARLVSGLPLPERVDRSLSDGTRDVLALQVKRSWLAPSDRPWLLPANLQNVSQLIDQWQRRKFQVRSRYMDAIIQLRGVDHRLRLLTPQTYRNVTLGLQLVPDKQQRMRLAQPAMMRALNGDWTFLAQHLRLPSRTGLAYMLWSHVQRGDFGTPGVALGSVGQELVKELPTREQMSSFWGFVGDYLRADAERCILRDQMRYLLTAALQIDAWNRDEAGVSVPDGDDPDGLPLFDLPRARRLSELMKEAWETWSREPDQAHQTYQVALWDLKECQHQLLRATVKPLTFLARIDPSSIPPEVRVHLMGWIPKTESSSRTKRTKAAVSEEQSSQLEELLALRIELEDAALPWDDLGPEARLRRLNPLNVWPGLRRGDAETTPDASAQ